MKTKLFFIAITLIIFAIGGLLLISPIKAATGSTSDISHEAEKMAELDQEVSAEDLGVKAEPLLLPDSRFYPLKNFWRKARMAFTFNPIKKVELQQKFADEKLIEAIKVYEKNKNSEQAEKLLEKYSEEIGLIAKRIEKIKKSPKNQTGVDNLLDNLADHLIKRQKVVLGIQEKLENKLPPEKYEKIAKQLDWTVGKLGVKIEQLEGNRELLKERFIKIAERQEGSEFKNFKNLEILKDLEEKMPLGASKAIEKARETIKGKFIQDMNKMGAEKRARFRNYINEINGDAIRRLEIIKEMESEEIKKEIIEKKEIIKEQYSKKTCKDLCGDGICQEVVCLAIGCPCVETAESCPEDCKKEEESINCLTEGQGSGYAVTPSAMEEWEKNPKKCCAGLDAISTVSQPYNGVCKWMVGYSGFICTHCGDGICKNGENYCNCPKDCPLPKCFKDGETMGLTHDTNPSRYCCSGLTAIKTGWGDGCSTYSNIMCTSAICGDGVCNKEKGENKCNCPKDCKEKKCTDTDGGKNLFRKGTTCPPSTISNGLSCKTDYCYSTDLVKEYYCKGDAIVSRTEFCRNGCSDGACKRD